MTQPGAAVMAGKEELPMAELLHDLDHVLGHHTEAVIDALFAGLGQRTVAIAAQIGEHDVIVLSQPRGDPVPRHVVNGMPVQQQKRRPRAAVPQADDRSLRAHVEMLEPGEKRCDLCAAPARRVAQVIGGSGFRDHPRRLYRLRYCTRGDARRRGPGGHRAHHPTPGYARFVLGPRLRGHVSLAFVEG
jgi:hypothetical protein